jgi:aryl-alcohol dehydrogenase-like predicted oxidoreductase
MRGVEASLERLHVSRLDACLLHNAVRIHEPAAVAALETVRRRGCCRRIGVSTYTPAEAMKALEYPGIDLVQIPYNVLDDRLDRIGFFVAARARNVQVYARSVLLQGLLAMPLDRFPARMEFARSTLEEFHGICSKLHLRPIEASLTSAMRHPGIDSVVFGTDNIAQLLQFIAIARDVSIADPREAFRDLASRTPERLVSPNLW